MSIVTIRSSIKIVPKPQARPRFGSIPAHNGRAGSSRKVVMSDPTKAYKQQVLRLFLADIGPQQRALLPLQGAVHMTVEFIFARPKSHYRAASLRPRDTSSSSSSSSSSHKKRKRSAPTQPVLTARAASMYIDHVVKPDIDNLAKSTMDAINGIAYTDDAQVTSGNFSKRWAHSPDEPSHINITMTGQPRADAGAASSPTLAACQPVPTQHITTLQTLMPSLR